MNHSKHKLYNHEVQPPKNVWSNIEQALDNAGNGQQFPEKLYAAEVTPPAGLWNNIAGTLDNDAYTGLSNKLQEAAVVPAAHNWDAIAAQLAADPYQELGQKLYNTTVTPPAHSWETIAAQLPAAVTPLLPVEKQKGILLPFLRFAAAAVLIGLTVFGAIKVFGPQSKNTGTDQQLVNTNPPVNTTGPDTVNPVVTDSPVTETSTAALSSQDETGNNPAPKRANNNYQHTVSNNSERIYASNTSENTTDRYVAFMTLDGNIVRMSKKMEDMICCVTGAEVTADCKTQLQKWQEKIADAPIALAPGNFMDIFSLVNTLNEGEL
jgi:hypothetical protein